MSGSGEKEGMSVQPRHDALGALIPRKRAIVIDLSEEQESDGDDVIITSVKRSRPSSRQPSEPRAEAHPAQPNLASEPPRVSTMAAVQQPGAAPALRLPRPALWGAMLDDEDDGQPTTSGRRLPAGSDSRARQYMPPLGRSRVSPKPHRLPPPHLRVGPSSGVASAAAGPSPLAERLAQRIHTNNSLPRDAPDPEWWQAARGPAAGGRLGHRGFSGVRADGIKGPGGEASRGAAVAAVGVAGGTVDDEEFAMRLQAEEDQRLAREIAEQEEAQRMRRRLDELEALEAAAAAAEDEQRPSHWRRSRSARATVPRGAHGGWGGALSALGGLLPGWPDPFPGVMFGAPPWLGGQPGGGMPAGAFMPAGRGGGPGRHMGRNGMREMLAAARSAGLPPHVLFSDRDFSPEDYEALCRLDEQVENRKGASQEEIDALPVTVAGKSGPGPGQGAGNSQELGAAGGPAHNTCCICLEDVAEGQTLRMLPCTHSFHQGCIDTWLKQKAACPVCQKPCK